MLGRVLLFVALMAQPVGAECLAEGQVPKFIDFGDGQVVRNNTVQSGLLTYETTAGGQPTYSEVRYGLYPELVRRGATENRFDWSGQVLTPAADLPVGQEVELKARTSGDSPGEFVFALTSLGPDDFTLGDCTYQVIHLKMRQGRAQIDHACAANHPGVLPHLKADGHDPRRADDGLHLHKGNGPAARGRRRRLGDRGSFG